MTKGKKIKLKEKDKEDYADNNLIERIISLECEMKNVKEDVKELKNRTRPLFRLSL